MIKQILTIMKMEVYSGNEYMRRIWGSSFCSRCWSFLNVPYHLDIYTQIMINISCVEIISVKVSRIKLHASWAWQVNGNSTDDAKRNAEFWH